MKPVDDILLTDPKRRQKLIFIFSVIAAVMVSMFFVAPISQDLQYHKFADTRTIFGLRNFWNVLSNLPFTIVGLMGMRLLVKYNVQPAALRNVYWVFFIGVFFVAFGSGYYHIIPGNQSLVWDRLPMTIAFMAFFASIISLCIKPELGPRLLIPLLVIGLFSVIYWHYTEQAGQGDLRPYALVQFLPMLLIPMMLILFSRFIDDAKYLWLVLLAYGISKLFELFDGQIYDLLGGISGHSLKHVAAAFGPYFFYLYLKKQFEQHSTLK